MGAVGPLAGAVPPVRDILQDAGGGAALGGGDELLHEADVVVLGLAAVVGHVGPAVGRDDLDELVDDLVGDERVAQVHLGDVGLAVSHLLERLEHLLGRVLVLGDVHHEPDELLEADAVAPARRLHEVVVHLVLAEDEAQRRERRRELELRQRVAVAAVEVPEHRLELLELDRRQVRHVPRHHLVLEEGELLLHGRLDEPELVGQLIVGVGREIVLLDVGLLALGVHGRDLLEEGVQGGQVVA